MYKNILVPLDGSEESEKVLPVVQDLLSPGGRVTLLHVIPPGKPVTVGDRVLLASEQEESERSQAMAYLNGLAGASGGSREQWTCEVLVSKAVVETVVDYANRAAVDLVVMYTRDRKGLSRLVKGSVARGVQRGASTEVQVVRPSEFTSI